MITDTAKPRICKAMMLGETGHKPNRTHDPRRIQLALARAGRDRETKYWLDAAQRMKDEGVQRYLTNKITGTA